MDKLLKAIKQHYQQEHHKEEEVQVTLANHGGYLPFHTYNLAHMVAHSCHVVATFLQVMEDDGGTEEGAEGNTDAACEEEIFSPPVFVNTRRGKGNGTKRKISDTATDASIPPSAAPVRPSTQLHRDTCWVRVHLFFQPLQQNM